ncbi:MAG: hypothetical protein QM762_16210 [Chryseolinea sp.]
MLRVFAFFAFLVIARISAFAQVDKTHWVDSVLNTLSVDERIGQLFMRVVPASANDDQITEVRNDVKSLDLGGVVFLKENPGHQVRVTNILQDTC